MQQQYLTTLQEDDEVTTRTGPSIILSSVLEMLHIGPRVLAESTGNPPHGTTVTSSHNNHKKPRWPKNNHPTPAPHPVETPNIAVACCLSGRFSAGWRTNARLQHDPRQHPSRPPVGTMAKASCVMTSDEEGLTGSLMLSQVRRNRTNLDAVLSGVE